MTQTELHERVRRIAEENRRLFQQIADGEERLRQLVKSVWRGQEQERGRLARDLHDGVGQTLTALKNQLQRLSNQQQPPDSRLAGQLAEAVELAAQALEETRQLSRFLRPAVLDDLGLEAALRWLTRSLRSSGLEVDLEVVGLEGALDPELETVIFRVVQEALTNVLKHAGTDRAEVRVARRGRRLELAIRDHGRGFDPDEVMAAAEGSGVRGIRDRVEVFGGKVTIESRPAAGTAITAELPVAPGAPVSGGGGR